MPTSAAAIAEFAKSIFEATPNNGPWDDYKFSPKSRTVYGKTVYNSEGLIKNVEGLVDPETSNSTVLSQGSLVTLDFGFNTCGLVSIEFGESTDGQEINLSYSESNQFIDKYQSDRSMDFLIEDGVHNIPVSGPGIFKAPWGKQRGAFRYLTLWTDKPGQIEVKSVSTYMTNMPSLGDDLRNYSGFFDSDDEFLNTIWYAAAYTVQLSTLPSNSGRRHDYVMKPTGWDNDVIASKGIEFLADGARRDRSIWSGDRAISVPAEAICFNSLSNKNSIEWLFEEQLESGQMPYACRPIATYGSDSYHLWSLIFLYLTYQYGGDLGDWVLTYWGQYKKAIEYAWKKVDETGLFKVDNGLDWGRNILKGHTTSVNCMLYHALNKGAILAEFKKDSEAHKLYLERAASLKKAINEKLWDEEAGLFRDFIDSDVHSHDGNGLIVLYDVADFERKLTISSNLKKRWNKYGAPAPESPGMISPFLGSVELLAHSDVGRIDRSLELIRIMWGWMWNAPYSVKSSLIEGYYHDGSCKYPFIGYDPAYISHAHPWASGPIILLTNEWAGLKYEENDHSKWEVLPRGAFKDDKFTWVKTGITSRRSGLVKAGFKTYDDNATLQIVAHGPYGTTGVVGVPIQNNKGVKVSKLTLNGSVVDVSSLEKEGEFYLLKGVKGQSSIITAY